MVVASQHTRKAKCPEGSLVCQQSGVHAAHLLLHVLQGIPDMAYVGSDRQHVLPAQPHRPASS